MKTSIKRKNWRAKDRRRNPELSLLQRMSPAEHVQARAIAYEAALAVIG